jgi:hypothetical protein
MPPPGIPDWLNVGLGSPQDKGIEKEREAGIAILADKLRADPERARGGKRIGRLDAAHGCCRLSMKRFFVTIACVAMMPGSAVPDSSPVFQPERYCAPLTNAVSVQLAGAKAGFVRSYDPGGNESALPAVLASTAFVYDNALAVIALVAWGDAGSAVVIGNALSAAVRNDRTFTDGRIRNAYRSPWVNPPTPLI